MQRTLNYTQRRKIAKKEALFSFAEKGAEVPEFEVVFSFDADDYPEDASLYVEAYHKETRQRFSFGKTSRIVPPQDRRLGEIDLSGPILFRVIIVEEAGKHGLLLASGEGFRAESDEDNKSSILSVVTRPLGQVPWKVEFETGGGPPELCLNNTILNAIEKMRTDPVFQSLILPAALRQVLTFYLWNEDDVGENESYEQWMAFANIFSEKPTGNDPIELMSWIDEVVEGFASRFELCDRFNTRPGEAD